jgi:hypothetical protein
MRYTRDDNNPWLQIPGSLIDVAAAAGRCRVGAAGNIFGFLNAVSSLISANGIILI